ncbi:MAG: hypothetical protein ABI920_08450 [Casimicrobiaceae bacterium]
MAEYHRGHHGARRAPRKEVTDVRLGLVAVLFLGAACAHAADPGAGNAKVEDWNYAAYTSARQLRPANQAECLACHKPLDKTSCTFTLEPLKAAAK